MPKAKKPTPLLLKVHDTLKFVWAGAGAFYLGAAVGDYRTAKDMGDLADHYAATKGDSIGVLSEMDSKKLIHVGYPFFSETMTTLEAHLEITRGCVKDFASFEAEINTRPEGTAAFVEKHYTPEFSDCANATARNISNDFRAGMLMNAFVAAGFAGLSILSQFGNGMLRRRLGLDKQDGPK